MRCIPEDRTGRRTDAGSAGRRLFLLTATVVTAVSFATSTAAPALADDHPPIFTFQAMRGAGQHVTYSGQYAKWDGTTGGYVATSDDVALTVRYTDTDEPGELARVADTTPDASGHFTFDELVPGAITVFASDGEVAFNDLGPGTESAPASVAAVRTVPAAFDGVEAFSIKHPRSKSQKPPIQVDGAAVRIAMTDADTGDRFEEVLHGKVAIQWKVGKHWKTARTVASSADGGGFSTEFKKVKSATWRVLLKAGGGHSAATSSVFKTAPRRSEN